MRARICARSHKTTSEASVPPNGSIKPRVCAWPNATDKTTVAPPSARLLVRFLTFLSSVHCQTQVFACSHSLQLFHNIQIPTSQINLTLTWLALSLLNFNKQISCYLLIFIPDTFNILAISFHISSLCCASQYFGCVRSYNSSWQRISSIKYSLFNLLAIWLAMSLILTLDKQYVIACRQ